MIEIKRKNIWIYRDSNRLFTYLVIYRIKSLVWIWCLLVTRTFSIQNLCRFLKIITWTRITDNTPLYLWEYILGCCVILVLLFYVHTKVISFTQRQTKKEKKKLKKRKNVSDIAGNELYGSSKKSVYPQRITVRVQKCETFDNATGSETFLHQSAFFEAAFKIRHPNVTDICTPYEHVCTHPCVPTNLPSYASSIHYFQYSIEITIVVGLEMTGS